jgi:hypothetical protein
MVFSRLRRFEKAECQHPRLVSATFMPLPAAYAGSRYVLDRTGIHSNFLPPLSAAGLLEQQQCGANAAASSAVSRPRRTQAFVGAARIPASESSTCIGSGWRSAAWHGPC